MRFKVYLKKDGKEFDKVVNANNKKMLWKLLWKTILELKRLILIGHSSFKDKTLQILK